jgi:hypothetical protein
MTDTKLTVQQALALIEGDPQPGYQEAARVLRQAIEAAQKYVHGLERYMDDFYADKVTEAQEIYEAFFPAKKDDGWSITLETEGESAYSENDE